MTAIINSGSILEQSDNSFFARVKYQGSAIVQANVDTIAVKVQRMSKTTGLKTTTYEMPDAPDELDPTDIIFDTLQTDERWTKDSTGFNFACLIPAAAFPGPDLYSILFTIITTAGGTIQVPFFDVPCVSLRGLA